MSPAFKERICSSNKSKSAIPHSTFKCRKSLELRKEEMKNIRRDHPMKIPVIVERFHKETSLPQLEKEKYLVPAEVTMSQFVSIIRTRMALTSSQAFYLIINNKSMACMSKSMGEIYREERDDDGFLYMVYASQEMFG
ncbi:putative Microtubule-associated proteins 1A/1B light chain 3C [Hypsibius exemplaris]|uniref:Microtubule-associated proteins 1A/1B light chain 3C n=1 Tax=Hypsibius exemplaris TaxID=2072580 RepID=A0A1W0XBE5_HYPEX|nr:putative Microtubule-associated proteins 1A/1B light chain 3C [Hypsibius exemplaris]